MFSRRFNSGLVQNLKIRVCSILCLKRLCLKRLIFLGKSTFIDRDSSATFANPRLIKSCKIIVKIVSVGETREGNILSVQSRSIYSRNWWKIASPRTPISKWSFRSSLQLNNDLSLSKSFFTTSLEVKCPQFNRLLNTRGFWAVL